MAQTNKIDSNHDTLSDVNKYYQNNSEAMRFQRQQLEFLVTLQLFAHYLKPKSKILELGAGAGAYTVELAKAGHEVTANEFCDPLLQQNRKACREADMASRVHHVPGDARLISENLQGKQFDNILIMGPMYHLVNESERIDLLKNLKSHLKPEGNIFSTHMTRLGYVKYVFQRTPGFLEQNPAPIWEIWNSGFNKEHPRDGNFRGYWTTADETIQLHKASGLQCISIHGIDTGLGANDEYFNALPMETKMAWADFFFKISGDSQTWSDARHIMCVAIVK